MIEKLTETNCVKCGMRLLSYKNIARYMEIDRSSALIYSALNAANA